MSLELYIVLHLYENTDTQRYKLKKSLELVQKKIHILYLAKMKSLGFGSSPSTPSSRNLVTFLE